MLASNTCETCGQNFSTRPKVEIHSGGFPCPTHSRLISDEIIPDLKRRAPRNGELEDKWIAIFEKLFGRKQPGKMDIYLGSFEEEISKQLIPLSPETWSQEFLRKYPLFHNQTSYEIKQVIADVLAEITRNGYETSSQKTEIQQDDQISDYHQDSNVEYIPREADLPLEFTQLPGLISWPWAIDESVFKEGEFESDFSLEDQLDDFYP